jgi:hypothetical protein
VVINLDSVLTAIDQALPIAKAYAESTAAAWDNIAVGIVTAIRGNSALMAWLHQLLDTPAVQQQTGDARTGAIHAAMESCPAEVKQQFLSLGFDWSTLLTYIPVVVRLMLTLLGLRG